MPEPQSTAFFVLLMVVFAALMCWLVLTRHLVLRVLAACLAFIPAVVFGVAAVNKYYDYYQSWNAAVTDITSQDVRALGPAAEQRRSGRPRLHHVARQRHRHQAGAQRRLHA